MDMTFRAATPAERLYTYTQSPQILGQTGCIGHLRADVSSGGNGFRRTWADHRQDLNSEEFQREFEWVLNALEGEKQYGAFLKSGVDMGGFCLKHPESSFNDGSAFGFRADTERHSYLIRIQPYQGEENLFVYCYRRDWLDRHLKQAEKGIRFIDPDYKELFRIPDGDQIRIIREDGTHIDMTCRYIDEYHVEIGHGWDSLFHICQFAEQMERCGNKVIPLRSSLPEHVTVTIYKKDVEDARAYFTRIGADLTARFAALGSKCVELDAADRLRILHDFYRPGDEGGFHFDMADMARKGHDFKDYICPDGIEKHSDYLKLGDRYCRVLFLKDYASYIRDDMVTELTDLNRNLMLSIDIISIPTDEAMREVENRLLGVETNITNWQRRQNSNNNFSAVIPYDMELQRKESKEFLNDLTTRDQRMMVAVLTMVITADSKEQLDTDTDRIRQLSGQRMCQMAVLKYQQLDGLNTVLPIGVRKIDAFRTLTTESLAVFMPFKVQEIMDRGGIYFGENAISHNLIMCNNLAFACSLRMGELLGLTWDCVDISQDSIDNDTAYIYVEKELQRISREALTQLGEKGIMLKFPTVRGCNSTILVLKEPKTRTSVRKVFLPKAVAEMLAERKREIDELKELLGDEYRDYNLVFASTQGTPTEANNVNRAFNKLIKENGLPKVVFHSLRHTSTTYKLKLSGGDIKAVQGDTGHAQATMVTERYAHILDDDRRVNAVRFQKEFYGGGNATDPEVAVTASCTESTQQAPVGDPLQSLDAATKQQLLLKLLAESPEMSALLTVLAGRSV